MAIEVALQKELGGKQREDLGGSLQSLKSRVKVEAQSDL